MDNSSLSHLVIWQYSFLTLFWTIMVLVSPTARRDFPKLKCELHQAFTVGAKDDGRCCQIAAATWRWSYALMRLPWIVLTWTWNVYVGDFQLWWTGYKERSIIRAEAWAKIQRLKALVADIRSRAAEQEFKRLRRLSLARAMNDPLASTDDEFLALTKRKYELLKALEEKDRLHQRLVKLKHQLEAKLEEEKDNEFRALTKRKYELQQRLSEVDGPWATTESYTDDPAERVRRQSRTVNRRNRRRRGLARRRHF